MEYRLITVTNSTMNEAQKIGHTDVTCMNCKFFEEIGVRYCNLADKKNDLDTPAYDCPFFKYSDFSMPKEVVEERQKEEKEKKQEDNAQKSNNILAVVVVIGCLISIGIAVSHASNSLDVVLDIVIGAVITIVLVHLINH